MPKINRQRKCLLTFTSITLVMISMYWVFYNERWFLVYTKLFKCLLFWYVCYLMYLLVYITTPRSIILFFTKCHKIRHPLLLFKSCYISVCVIYITAFDIRANQDQHKNMAMYRTLIGCTVMLMISTLVPTCYVSVINHYWSFP